MLGKNLATKKKRKWRENEMKKEQNKRFYEGEGKA